MAAAQRGKADSQPGTEQPDLTTLAGRLRYAIDRRPPVGRRRGVRLFQRDMQTRAAELESQGRRLPGITLPTIMSYLNGGAMPSLDFIDEAARVLRVRPAWLSWRDGEMTSEEEYARRDVEARSSHVRQLRGAIPVLEDLPYAVTVALLHHLDLWERAQATAITAEPPALLVERAAETGRRPPRGRHEKKVGILPAWSDPLEYMANTLWPTIVAPLERRRPYDMVAFSEYVVAALHARNLALLLDTYDPQAED